MGTADDSSPGGTIMTLTLERLEDLRSDLASRAFLYDDPETFRAAIDLAVQMLRDTAARERSAVPTRHPAGIRSIDLGA